MFVQKLRDLYLIHYCRDQIVLLLGLMLRSLVLVIRCFAITISIFTLSAVTLWQH